MSDTSAAGRPYRDHVADRPRFLTSVELARVLGISVRAVQRYRSEGLITPTEETLGGHARWIEADVREQMRRIREQRRTDRESE